MRLSGMRPRHRVLVWIAGTLLLLSALSLSLLAYLVRQERWAGVAQRTPMELVRYAERRLIGHPRLEKLAAPLLDAVRRRSEQEPPAGLPTLGKGQQAHALFARGHDSNGRPRALTTAAPTPAPSAAPTRLVDSVPALAAALAEATAGELIVLAPGRYLIARDLYTGHPGRPEAPIVVRALQPGTARLEVDTTQGLVVNQPYWVFENLDWRGVCAQHEQCEQAFHIVGGAVGTVVLNNRISDFNAHVKINGENGQWPDNGLLQFSTLTNSTPRNTNLPVSPIDHVGPNGWQILDNLVERFVKAGSNRISYGMCIKGAGEGTDIERNLVVCTPERVSQPGLRLGISLGCGNTGESFCRGGNCEVELKRGVVANNVVAHCNDFGIDLNRAADATVAHNTLVNTEGIDARNATTRARVVGNLVEGRVRSRDGAVVIAEDNETVRALEAYLVSPNALDLRWLESSDRARATPETERDFCGARRPPMSPPGATLRADCTPAK